MDWRSSGRILNLAARKWRDEHGLTWLETPPLLTFQEVDDARSPYPLSWEEQECLLKALPDHLARMTLFKVNTGTREQEVCRLQWDWEVQIPEVQIPELQTSVFLIPRQVVKNKEDRLGGSEQGGKFGGGLPARTPFFPGLHVSPTAAAEDVQQCLETCAGVSGEGVCQGT